MFKQGKIRTGKLQTWLFSSSSSSFIHLFIHYCLCLDLLIEQFAELAALLTSDPNSSIYLDQCSLSGVSNKTRIEYFAY